jgi:hypothetical protein
MPRTAAFVFIIILAVIVCSSLLWPTTLWGADSWAFVSLETGIVLAVLSLVLLNRTVAGVLLPPAPRSGFSGIKIALLIASSAVVFWLLRAKHDFWGDGHAVAAALERPFALHPGAPLAVLLNHAVFRLLNGILLLDAMTSSTLLAVLMGVCYVGCAVAAGRLLFGARGDRSRLAAFATALLLANGYIAVFFAGGTAPVAVVASTAFLLASVAALRGTVTLHVPAALLGIAVLTDLSNCFLLPGFIFLIAHQCFIGRRVRAGIEAVGVAAVCYIALDFILSRMGGPRPSAFLAEAVADLAARTGPSDVYATQNRLLDALNALLLIGPASVAALVMAAVRRTDSPPGAAPAAAERRCLLIHAASG